MFKIRRTTITRENANSLMKNKKITLEEHAEFFMNFVYTTCVSEKARNIIGIDAIQKNLSQAVVDFSQMDAETLGIAYIEMKRLNYIVDFVQNEIRKNMKDAVDNTSHTFDEENVQFVSESTVAALTFDDIENIINQAMVGANQIAPVKISSKDVFIKLTKSQFNIVWNNLSAMAINYQNTFLIGHVN